VSLPVEFLDDVVTALRERGRDCDASELTTSEIEQIANGHRVGRSAEQTAAVLAGERYTPRTWEPAEETEREGVA
jgi:hypothetical protein